MDNKLRLGLSHIVGAFYIVRSGAIKHYVTIDNKEDYERSIKFYLSDKNVLRLENYTMKTKYYTESGGMQDFLRDFDETKKESIKLLERYPSLVKVAKPKIRAGQAKFEIKLKM
jgi:hypothetical protein